MTNQGDRQDFFRAISGTSTDYNGDFLAAAATESFTGEFNGVFVQWLQDRTGSSATNLDGLKQEFAELAGTHNWESTGGVPIILEGCQLWLDSADSSTITESSGSVSQQDDKSSNDNDVTQGTGAQQPTTNATTENGLNVIDYDGGDDLIMPSALHAIPNGANTTFCVAKRTSEDASTDTIIGMATTTSNDWFVIYASTAGVISFKNRITAAGAVSSTGNTNTDFNIITCRRSGTTQGISVNGETEITNASGEDAASIDDAFIGMSGAETLHLDGNIAELIIFDRSLSAAEITVVNQYLSAKRGIALV